MSIKPKSPRFRWYLGKRLLLFVAVSLAFLLGLLGWFAYSVAPSTSETDLAADSSVVWYEFPTNGEFRIISITLACEQGKPTCVVKLEEYTDVTKYRLPIDGKSYARLWRVLTENGIWELPSGEYWPYLELFEAEGSSLPSVKLVEEDYQGDMIDASITGIKVRVGQKRHGSLRYWIHGLKDKRYAKIQSAMWDFVDLPTVVERWRRERH